MLKVGASKYPAVFGRATRLKEYKRELAPMQFEKIETTRIHQSPLKSMAIEQCLHVEKRFKYGNVRVPEVSSNEIYVSKHLQAILDLLCKLEQLTISQVEDEKKVISLRKERTR